MIKDHLVMQVEGRGGEGGWFLGGGGEGGEHWWVDQEGMALGPLQQVPSCG